MLPYEKQARANAPMPDGLAPIDQGTYQAIASLAARSRMYSLTPEQARLEYVQIIDAHDKATSELQKAVEDRQLADRYIEHHAEFMMAMEDALTRYAKEKTMDAADYLYRIAAGLERGTRP